MSNLIESIPLTNLLINVDNPRYEPQISQRDALMTLATEQDRKLVQLAADIATNGLNPTELPIVKPSTEAGEFIVLEGNRRVAALKFLASPSLLASLGLPKRIVDGFKKLPTDHIPSEITCTVMTMADAGHWMLLRHTGENGGVGVVNWDGAAMHRFRGKFKSPALQAVDMVAESGFLDEETKAKLPKIAITNVERMLGTADAREIIGIEVTGGRLDLDPDRPDALARLAMIVADIAQRKMKVTDLDSRQQRLTYAKEIANRDIPALWMTGGAKTNGSSTSNSSTDKETTKRRKSPVRKALIPSNCRLTIQHTRLNQIYHELLRLNVEAFTNSCAVTMRVFVELSIDEYASRHKLSLRITPKPRAAVPAPQCPHCSGVLRKAKAQPPTERETNLREKIKAAFDHMSAAGMDKHLLTGIKHVYANRDHVLSVGSWNAYVHNQHYNPTPTDLKANWDSIQPFVEQLWAK